MLSGPKSINNDPSCLVGRASQLVSQLGRDTLSDSTIYDHIFLTYKFFELSQSLGSVARLYLTITIWEKLKAQVLSEINLYRS